MGMGGNGNGNGFMGMGGNGNRNSPSRTPLPLSILESRPWPFRVTWRHRSRDHLSPRWPFPAGAPLSSLTQGLRYRAACDKTSIGLGSSSKASCEYRNYVGTLYGRAFGRRICQQTRKNIAKSPILRFWAYISFLYLSEVKYAPRNETVGTSVVRIRHISLWPVKLIST